MGKRAKEHRKKVQKRNESIKIQTKQIDKAREKFIMDLIEKERKSGKFDGPTVPQIGNQPGPNIDGPIIGPTI